jgi:hypothetical protein
MTKIRSQLPGVVLPVEETATPEPETAAAAPEPSVASFDPAMLAPAQRPAVLTPTLGDKRTDSTLRGLASSAQLISNQASAVSAQESLESAHAALTRARSAFKPESGERKMSDELIAYVRDAQRATPTRTAESLVVQRFPDFQSPSHGDFKKVARVIDSALALRDKGQTDTALQVALGFVPGLGTALDLRDLLHALDRLHDHHEGAGLEVDGRRQTSAPRPRSSPMSRVTA